MAVPQSKTELLSAIEVNFDKLMHDLRAVPLDLADDCGLDGHAAGTRMSIANLVSYLIGWNELVLKWLDRDKAGLPVDFPETGFKWSELGRLAQKFYRDYEALPYPALLQRLEAAKERIVSEIESRSDDTLYGRGWRDGKWTMGRMIQFNTSSPYANARARLRKRLRAKQASAAGA
ncbi:Uncharacterized conserved protein [Brevundimonas diminuta]|uniref:ClbS/DfsB family four-helix bundle protein n=1 Tax=Brevundimonas diminuta TaxID=293 RepID=UPI000D893F45|nr:ClbS/DfsB family four-helix bundle protein [Brevundimonas diminuta]SPU43291.1 Uncharacterized conserved protein [Brevundimonas diminuta]